jgi:hypothetical protein
MKVGGVFIAFSCAASTDVEAFVYFSFMVEGN